MKSPIKFQNNVPDFITEKYVATWDYVAAQYERQDVAALHMAHAMKSSGVRLSLGSKDFNALQDYVIWQTLDPFRKTLATRYRSTRTGSLFVKREDRTAVFQTSGAYMLQGTLILQPARGRSFEDALKLTSLLRVKTLPAQMQFSVKHKKRDLKALLETRSRVGEWYVLSDDKTLRIEVRRFGTELLLRYTMLLPKAILIGPIKTIQKVWKEMKWTA